MMWKHSYDNCLFGKYIKENAPQKQTELRKCLLSQAGNQPNSMKSHGKDKKMCNLNIFSQ